MIVLWDPRRKRREREIEFWASAKRKLKKKGVRVKKFQLFFFNPVQLSSVLITAVQESEKKKLKFEK